MSPEVISTVRLTIRIAVVLPQPEGPTRTQISPASTSRVSDVDRVGVGPRVALGDVRNATETAP